MFKKHLLVLATFVAGVRTASCTNSAGSTTESTTIWHVYHEEDQDGWYQYQQGAAVAGVI
jgi:hypothetical protein